MKRLIPALVGAICSLFAMRVLADDVAEVNGVGQATMADAMSALNANGGMLKLLTDVESSSFYSDWTTSGTIDLNGKTLTVNDQFTQSPNGLAWLTYKGSGTFTIKNGTVNILNKYMYSSGGASNASEAAKRVAGIVEVLGSGTLNVESVTCGTDTRYPAIQVGTGTAYVRHCAFTAGGRHYAAVVASGGTAVVEDTEVCIGTYDSYVSSALRANSGGTLTVRGGTYTVPSASGNRVISVDTSGADINIDGGTFSGMIYLDIPNATVKRTVTITAGTFANFAFGNRSNSGTYYGIYHLSGGTYSANPQGSDAHGVTIAEYCEVTGSGPYTVKVNDSYEAVIGTTPYEDIDTAIDALVAGQTLKVTKSCTSDVFHSLSVNATIDLDGKTVTVSKQGSTSGTPWLTTTGDLKLKNGSVSIYNADVYGNDKWCVGIANTSGGTLTVEDIVCLSDTRYPAIQALTGGTAVVRRCTFTAGNRYYAAVAAAGGTAMVEDTTVTISQFKGNDVSAALRVNTGGTMTVKSGSFSVPNGKYVVSIATSGGTINIQNGSFNGKLGMDGDGNTRRGYCNISGGTFSHVSFDVFNSRSAYNTYTITGGTFDAKPNAYVPGQGLGDYVVEPDDDVGPWTVRPRSVSDANVVVNGTIPCETLAEAFSKVTSGGTVLLMKDMEVTAELSLSTPCTVDLGGKTVTPTFSSVGHFIAYSGAGELTLKNGTLATGSNCNGPVKTTAGTLVLEGIASTACNSDNAALRLAGTATITNCVISSSQQKVINFSLGTCTVVDSTLSYTGASGTAWAKAVLAASDGATIDVKSGTFTTTSGNYIACLASSGGSFVFEGGAFTGKIYLDGRSDSQRGSCTISGGTFSSVAYERQNTTYDTYVISGGTFSADPTAHKAEGCEVVKHTAGMKSTWTVQQGKTANTVAQITRAGSNSYYDTLAEAIAALQANETVTVVKSCTLGAQFVPAFSCTFDLGGFVVTTDGISDYAFKVASDVTLTVRNGTLTGGSGCSGVVLVTAGAAHLIGLTNTVDSAISSPSVKVEGGSATVTGCAFLGDDRQASGVYTTGSSSSATVNDSVVKVKTGTSWANAPLRVAYGASIVVNGGTYEAVSGGFAIYILTSGGTIDLNGGAFSGVLKNDNNYSTYKGTGTVTITDGTFCQAKFFLQTTENGSNTQYNKFKILGGTYDVDPSKYVDTSVNPKLKAKRQGDIWSVGVFKSGVVLQYW